MTSLSNQYSCWTTTTTSSSLWRGKKWYYSGSTYGLFTLDDTENDTETETDNMNYGFHCNVQSTSHCTETLPLMPLATFSHFIIFTTYILLGVAQCEHTIHLRQVTNSRTHAKKSVQHPCTRKNLKSDAGVNVTLGFFSMSSFHGRSIVFDWFS